MSTPTRRGLMSAAVALPMSWGGETPPHGAEGSVDAKLIALCAAFQEAQRAHNDFNYDTTNMCDETSIRLTNVRDGLMEKVTAIAATTHEGLRAKAGVVRAALHYDILEYIEDTFADRAQPYHLLADSLCRDLLGSAAA